MPIFQGNSPPAGQAGQNPGGVAGGEGTVPGPVKPPPIKPDDLPPPIRLPRRRRDRPAAAGPASDGMISS